MPSLSVAEIVISLTTSLLETIPLGASRIVSVILMVLALAANLPDSCFALSLATIQRTVFTPTLHSWHPMQCKKISTGLVSWSNMILTGRNPRYRRIISLITMMLSKFSKIRLISRLPMPNALLVFCQQRMGQWNLESLRIICSPRPKFLSCPKRTNS